MANLEEELLKLEDAFWKGDADFYRQRLSEDCLMVFSDPVGLLEREQIIETIGSSQRWAEVHFDAVHLLKLGAESALLTYLARARHDGDEADYVTRASSAYVRREDEWKLAFHQQTASGQ